MTESTQTFEQVASERYWECYELLVKKHRDYGPGNISSWGLIGLAVRTNDKIERVKNLLTKHREATNESLRDSFLDIANYGIIGLMWIDGVWGMPLEEEAEAEEQRLSGWVAKEDQDEQMHSPVRTEDRNPTDQPIL